MYMYVVLTEAYQSATGNAEQRLVWFVGALVWRAVRALSMTAFETDVKIVADFSLQSKNLQLAKNDSMTLMHWHITNCTAITQAFVSPSC